MCAQTTNLGLNKPGAGDANWEGRVRSNWKTLDEAGYVSTCISWNLLTGQPDSIGQGDWSRQQTSSRFYCGEFRNPSVNDGDNFSCKFRCPAGTYKLRFNAVKNTDGGIVKVYIDTVQVGDAAGYDTYSSPKDVYNIEEAEGIVLTAGEHTLKFELDGKNASSDAYRFRTSGITLQRTA